MTILIIFSATTVTLLLNFLFVRKIGNKLYKFCMGLINFILAIAFITLFIHIGSLKNYLNSFIDFGIAQLESRVNEIYPGALEMQMNTEEIKNLLEESIEERDVDGIEALAENIIKSRIKKYTSVTLKTLNALERESNKISVKDALISIKELSIDTVSPYIRTLYILLFALYFVSIIVSVLIAIHLSKNKVTTNDGIVFGEEADKTFIGMKTE